MRKVYGRPWPGGKSENLASLLVAWLVFGVVATAAPSATTTTKGARSAPAPLEAALVVFLAEGAAVADDAENKPVH